MCAARAASPHSRCTAPSAPPAAPLACILNFKHISSYRSQSKVLLICCAPVDRPGSGEQAPPDDLASDSSSAGNLN